MHSFESFGNDRKCPFCNSDQDNKTDEERVEDIMKRVESNDPTSICLLAQHYHHGTAGLQQNHSKAVELYARAADLGSSKALITWVLIIMKEDIQRKRSSTMRPRLWQGMKWQGSTLDARRNNQEIWNEL